MICQLCLESNNQYFSKLWMFTVQMWSKFEKNSEIVWSIPECNVMIIIIHHLVFIVLRRLMASVVWCIRANGIDLTIAESYGSWIYNYLCNQYLSPLMLWVWISIRARCTTLCDKVCQWLATGRWFSPGTPVSSTNKTDRHDITEILCKMALNTIKQT
jgi:hypothetical protein